MVRITEFTAALVNIIGSEKINEPQKPTASSGSSNAGKTSRGVAVVLSEKSRKNTIGKIAPGIDAIKTDFPKCDGRI
jgi:hypothetical protein